MREFSADTVAQLTEQLSKVTKGTSSKVVAEKRASTGELTAQEAMIETAFLIAAVDGNVSALELVQFADAVHAVFGDAEDPKALLETMAKRLEAQGWEARAKAVARALEGSGQGEQAYRIAATVAFVDDVVEHAEVAALDVIARAAGLTDDRAHEILTEIRHELFGD